VENFGGDMKLKRLDLTWSGQRLNGGDSQVYRQQCAITIDGVSENTTLVVGKHR